jgi:hypothetical protein
MAFSLANRSPSLAAIHGLGVGLGVCKRGCTREEPHAEAPRAARSWAGLSRGARGRVEQSEKWCGLRPRRLRMVEPRLWLAGLVVPERSSRSDAPRKPRARSRSIASWSADKRVPVPLHESFEAIRQRSGRVHLGSSRVPVALRESGSWCPCQGCGGKANDSAARPQLGRSLRGPEASRPWPWEDGEIDPDLCRIHPSN